MEKKTQFHFFFLFPTVIDDENPTVYTANAIVTVTVILTRKDMNHLFGDDTIKEQTTIDEDNQNGEAKVNNVAPEVATEDQNITAEKRPAWLKQKKGTKKAHKKKSNKKVVPTKSATTPKTGSQQEETPTPKARKKEDKEKNDQESTKEKALAGSDSDAESERSDEEESSNDKKEDTIEDDDSEWEK